MSKIYISELANQILKNYLTETGHQIMEVKKTDQVYDEIATHPDIYMCNLGGQLVFSDEDLGYNYPDNIKYNAACVGKYFIHNTKYTAPKLLKLAKDNNYEIINVKQGYTKCNIAIVDENSIITSDEGIAEAVKEYGIDALLIEPGHVKLPGFSHGFLGGACGRVGDSMVFNGDLSEHPNYAEIASFLLERNLRIQYFDEYELEDIGSIIEI